MAGGLVAERGGEGGAALRGGMVDHDGQIAVHVVDTTGAALLSFLQGLVLRGFPVADLHLTAGHLPRATHPLATWLRVAMTMAMVAAAAVGRAGVRVHRDAMQLTILVHDVRRHEIGFVLARRHLLGGRVADKGRVGGTALRGLVLQRNRHRLSVPINILAAARGSTLHR